jgi:hypothetical protein
MIARASLEYVHNEEAMYSWDLFFLGSAGYLLEFSDTVEGEQRARVEESVERHGYSHDPSPSPFMLALSNHA